MKVTWLTQGSFLFEQNGFRLVVDPYMSDSLAGRVTRLAPFPLALEELCPDAVLCTHDHLDHLDPETIRMISGRYPACDFGGPEQAFRHLSRLGVPAPRELSQGQPASFGPFEVTAVFAHHSDPTAVGLVIRHAGQKIYLTGDTEFDEQLVSSDTMAPDVLLICINGRLGNMHWRQAVSVAEALSPGMALPMHYGLFAENTEDPAPFIAACALAGIHSFEMKTGEAFTV